MKLRTKIVIVLAVVIVVAIGRYRHREYYRHKEPPPGWKIVTDGHGHYAAQTASGYVLKYRRHFMYSVVRSKQAAINAAWEQHEFENAQDNYQNKWR